MAGLLDDVLRSSLTEMDSHLGALAGTAPREIKTKDTSNGCQDGRVDDGQGFVLDSIYVRSISACTYAS